MEALSKIVQIATNEPEPEWEAEFNRWYDEEHVPGLLTVPGYRSGRRYTALEGEPKYMAMYEIDSLAAFESPEHDAVNATPWCARIKPHYAGQRGFFEQIFPKEGFLRGPSWGNAEASGLMVIQLAVGASDEADFNGWYDEEHLPALCKVPGVIAARRFRALKGSPKSMAVYYLETPDVQTTAPWKNAIDTPWSERVRTKFTSRWRAVYRPI